MAYIQPYHPYRGPNIEGRSHLTVRIVLFNKFISLLLFGMVVGVFFAQDWAVPSTYQAMVAVCIYFIIDLMVLIFSLVVVGFRR